MIYIALLHSCKRELCSPCLLGFCCWKKNLISWELEQDMRYNKKVTPSVLWPLAPNFNIFQSGDGLPSGDFVYTNNLCVWETEKPCEGHVCDIFCVSAIGASRSLKGNILIYEGSLWLWRRVWIKSRCRRRCWKTIRPASLWLSPR